MSQETTRNDAGRVQTIREAGRKLGIPDDLVGCIVSLGYSAAEADELFASYKHDGCLRLKNNAGWGDPKPKKADPPKVKAKDGDA